MDEQDTTTGQTLAQPAPAGALLQAAGEIVAADPVHGWHFKPYLDWEALGAGTQLYVIHASGAASAASAVTMPAPLAIGDWIPGYCGAIATRHKNGSWNIGHSNSVDPASEWKDHRGRVSSGPQMMRDQGYVAWLPLDPMPNA